MAGMRAGRNEDALSEIIGFVLVLALVVVASTLYLLYVVPAEGREDEITHMNKVQDRFVSYKTSVDGLWLRSIETNFVPPDTGGVSLSTSFDLGTGGGNTQSSGLFLSFMRPIGTAAKMRTQLDSTPSTPTSERIGLAVDGIPNLTYTDQSGTWPDVAIGSLSYHTDNYYWIQQNYYYKLGGVFLEQPNEGVSVKVAPPIAIYNVTNATDPLRNTTKVSISLVNITSPNSTVGGTGPLRVETRLRESVSSPHQDQPAESITLRIVSFDNDIWVKAWRQVFVDAVQKSGLSTAHMNIEDPTRPNANQWFYIPDWNPGDTETSLTIRNKTAIAESPPVAKDVYLDLNEATLQVTFEYDE